MINIDYNLILIIFAIFLIIINKDDTIYNFIYNLKNSRLKNKYKIGQEVLCTFKDNSVELVTICGVGSLTMAIHKYKNCLYSCSYVVMHNGEYVYVAESVLDETKTPLQEI